MAGYLLSRLPGLKSVEFDIQGEIQNNQFDFHQAADSGTSPLPADSAPSAEQLTATARNCDGAPRGLSKLQAMSQAGQDVSKVFKVGKGYRFSVFDHASQGWQDGPLLKSQDEAERLRERVFASRYEALQRAE
jgi:hypothetical protein